MDKRSYDRSESVNIDGKPFHFTPDRKEFLSELNIGFLTKPNVTLLKKILTK